MNNYPNPSPPLISLTPLLGPRTRLRAGTLPSSLFSGRLLLTLPMIPTSTDALGLPTMELLLLPQPALDQAPQQTAPQGRRMRSGSLFSTNLIWNDDALATSPQLLMYDQQLSNESNLASQSQFLNIPTNEATPQGRNRSYTTTGAPNLLGGLPNQQYLMFDSFGLNRVSPFTQTPHTVANTDVNSLLDSLMLNIQPQDTTYSPTPRIRSQTFLGSAPLLPDLLIGQAPPPPPVFNVYQQGAQQQPAQPQQPQPQQQSYYAHQPVLQDDFDITLVALTTNFDNPNLGPTKNILLDNLPQFIDLSKLYQVLVLSLGNQRLFGGIQAVRICPVNNSKLALVECLNVDTAMSLKASFNHIEFVPGVVLYVAFAKVGSQSIAAQAPAAATTLLESTTPPKQNGQNNHKSSEKPAPIEVSAIQPHLLSIIDTLAANNQLDRNKVRLLIKNAIDYDNNKYQNNFGPLPDPIPLRQFDLPKLRELRKILENNEAAVSGTSCPLLPNQSGLPSPLDRVMSQFELEELCLAMLDELPELCYDYLGNTIIQKLFVLVELPVIKLMMVKEIAPYLTQLAIHKNGTWAIQKIINLAIGHKQQMSIIAELLKPYAVKLFNDQFGNYVLQGCVKFGLPYTYNDFIFETLLDNFLEISFGRFGARCIRTILENAEGGHIPYEQVMLVALLIVEFANDLVVNSNGSLLITWFLDTFNLEPIAEGRARLSSLGTRQRSSSMALGSIKDDRYALLTHKFLPNLARLCTHKLANLTILKIINNRLDLVLKQIIMDAIFGLFEECERQMAVAQGMDEYSYPQPSRLLEQILQENPEHNAAGPLFIYKILLNPLALTLPDSHNSVDSKSNLRYFEFIVSQVKRILLELNITNLQPYKKLMDEVGLPTNRILRTALLGGGQGRRNKRSVTRTLGSPLGKQYHNSYYQHQVPNQNHGHGQGPSQAQTNPNYQIPQVYGGPAMPMHMLRPGQQPAPMAYPLMAPHDLDSTQQLQQDMAVMKQLEQLSLSSAAMGYNSSPGTPSTNRNQFL
ncbi:hypothetical protein JNB11_03565 [Kocuria palustris]|nr:hypothetical protein [Kocuria palustris]